MWGKWSKALGWLLQPPRPWCFAMSFWKLAWRSAKRPTMLLWRSWGSVKPLRCRQRFGGEQDDGPIFGGTGNDHLIVKEWFDESWLSFNVSWIWQSWQFFDPRWPPRWVSTYCLAWWPSGVSKSSAALLKTSGLWFLGKKTPTTLNEYIYIYVYIELIYHSLRPLYMPPDTSTKKVKTYHFPFLIFVFCFGKNWV